MDGGDAPVSRLLSLCKPIPCSYRFKYPFPAARPILRSVVAASRRFSFVCAAGALIAAALLFGGGSGDGAVAWIGGAALVVALVACGLAFWGLLPLPGLGREGIAFALLGGGFAVWTGLTVVWSVLPDRSWDYFNRGLAYFAFAVVGAFAGSVLSTRVGAWLLGGLVVVTCLWALAGKAVPALYEDYGRLARLRSPVGYWNALALVMVFGLPIALWAASSRRHSRVVRAGAVVGLYALLIALVLTYSRGGMLAAFVALAGWFALTRQRFESLAALVSGGVPAGVVCGIALLLPGIAQDGQSHSVRVHDGAWFALAFVLGAGAAFAAAWFLHYRPGPERERLLLRAAAGVAVACVLAGVIVVSASGNPLGGSASVGSGPSRLGESSLNNRWGWWKEAWHGFAGEPLGGTGAGSFEIVHRKFRDSAVTCSRRTTCRSSSRPRRGSSGSRSGSARWARRCSGRGGRWVGWTATSVRRRWRSGSSCPRSSSTGSSTTTGISSRSPGRSCS